MISCLGRICLRISKAWDITIRGDKLISPHHFALANENFTSLNLKSDLQLKEDAQVPMGCLRDKYLVGLTCLFNARSDGRGLDQLISTLAFSGEVVEELLTFGTIFMTFISTVSKLEQRIPEILTFISESVSSFFNLKFIHIT